MRPQQRKRGKEGKKDGRSCGRIWRGDVCVGDSDREWMELAQGVKGGCVEGKERGGKDEGRDEADEGVEWSDERDGGVDGGSEQECGGARDGDEEDVG